MTRLDRRRVLAIGAGAAAALASRGAPVSASWQTGGLAGAVVRSLVVDRSNPGVVFAVAPPGSAGSRSGLLRSNDAGKSWFSLERGLPAGVQPTTFAISPDEGRTALLGAVDGLYRSTNGGASWSRVTAHLPPVTALLFERSEPRTVIAGTELSGNYRSTDGGVTWSPANRGLPRDRYGITPGAVQLLQHPTEAGTLLMAASGAVTVYRSQDRGQSWSPAMAGLPKQAILALAAARGEPGLLLALTDRALFRSTDGGGNWTQVSGISAPDFAALYADVDARDHVYVATARGTLHRSTNAGGSWVELPSLPRPVRMLTSLPGASFPSLAAAAGEGMWQLALRPTLPFSPEPAANNRQYFPETGHNVGPTFLPFYRARGAQERFGLPRTEELTEEGNVVQYFQRARLEYRPEHRGTPYEVQISLLGETLLGASRPGPVEAFESSADQRHFEETGHSVNFAFLRYFTTRGGVDSFGFPLTEEMQENGRPVQYFQRARLEYRAELAGRTDEVSVGPIGDEILRKRGWLD